MKEYKIKYLKIKHAMLLCIVIGDYIENPTSNKVQYTITILKREISLGSLNKKTKLTLTSNTIKFDPFIKCLLNLTLCSIIIIIIIIIIITIIIIIIN